MEIAGKSYYIKEDDGQISFLEEETVDSSDVMLLLQTAGGNFSYDGRDFYIEEVGVFRLVNLKGFVNTKLIIGKEYEYLVGIFQGKKYVFEKEIGGNMLRIQREIESFSV